jgi:hypothetical protein
MWCQLMDAPKCGRRAATVPITTADFKPLPVPMNHTFNQADSSASQSQMLLALPAGRLDSSEQLAGHFGVWCAAPGYPVDVLIHRFDGRVAGGYSRFKRGEVFSMRHAITLPPSGAGFCAASNIAPTA